VSRRSKNQKRSCGITGPYPRKPLTARQRFEVWKALGYLIFVGIPVLAVKRVVGL